MSTNLVRPPKCSLRLLKAVVVVVVVVVEWDVIGRDERCRETRSPQAFLAPIRCELCSLAIEDRPGVIDSFIRRGLIEPRHVR